MLPPALLKILLLSLHRMLLVIMLPMPPTPVERVTNKGSFDFVFWSLSSNSLKK